MAIEIAANRTALSLTIGTRIVGAAPITVMHQCNRRKNKDEEGQHRQKLSPEEERIEVERISKKNQFALFAFQRTLHLLAAFCGTIFLKLCNQKTRFILRLI